MHNILLLYRYCLHCKKTFNIFVANEEIFYNNISYACGGIVSVDSKS
jgi:hypothetical protein